MTDRQTKDGSTVKEAEEIEWLTQCRLLDWLMGKGEKGCMLGRTSARGG
jgi:hypothetical protein